MRITSEPLLAKALRALSAGKIVAHPTDTLLGLAVRADSAPALRHLFEVKGRPEGSPVSVLFSSVEEIEPWARLTPRTRALLRTSLPGPYTFLVPASPRARKHFAPGVLLKGETLGVRIPDHVVARALAHRAGPVTSTSANRHGAPNCRTFAEIRRVLGDGVEVCLDLPPAPSGQPSTLIDLTGERPRVVPR